MNKFFEHVAVKSSGKGKGNGKGKGKGKGKATPLQAWTGL
jgi:hypothetical protein